MAPRREYPLTSTLYSSVGNLPKVSLGKPPKNLVLSARNSKMFGHCRARSIPPIRYKPTHLNSTPRQEIKRKKPETSGHHSPSSHPEDTEVKVQDKPDMTTEKEVPVASTEEDEHLGAEPSSPLTNGVPTSIKCNPSDLCPTPAEDSLSETSQMGPMSSPQDLVGDELSPKKTEEEEAISSNST